MAINPLPSLLRASSWDAGNFTMRKAGRTKWNEDDYNAAAETQNRLIKGCYGREADTDEHMCFLRFQIAEDLERSGVFGLRTKLSVINAFIDSQLAA